MKRHHDDESDDEGPQPDRKLEQGEALPIRLSAAFDELDDEWVGIPLEDVDSFYKNIPVELPIFSMFEIINLFK